MLQKDSVRTSLVMITKDRRDNVLHTLQQLEALPQKPPILLIDNGSTDGTVAAVERRFPSVTVLALTRNLGAAARNMGVKKAKTPFIAFVDDDSWWDTQALSKAEELFDQYPNLGLLAAQVLLGEEQRIDPACLEMAHSPLQSSQPLPGPFVLGFIACGAIVRRSAFLEAGGFNERYGVGGEEELLALDMAAAGWGLAYVDDLVAFHHPSKIRNRRMRQRGIIRNKLWTAWMRRPLNRAAHATWSILLGSAKNPDSMLGMVEAARSLPWALQRRRPVPKDLEEQLRLLERHTLEA